MCDANHQLPRHVTALPPWQHLKPDCSQEGIRKLLHVQVLVLCWNMTCSVPLRLLPAPPCSATLSTAIIIIPTKSDHPCNRPAPRTSGNKREHCSNMFAVH
jgi:hypothetical protein